MSHNRRLIVLAGLVISVVFLWLAFRDLQPQSFIANIRRANAALLLIGALVYFVAVTVIALRWQFLLRSIRFIPLRQLAPLVAIGYMGNNVYPFRAGEALRIFLLKRDFEVPIARGTTTVLVERAFDGLVMLSFIGLSLLFVNVPSNEIRTVATMASPVFVGAVVLFFLLAARPDLLRRLVDRMCRLLPSTAGDRIAALSEEVIHGLEGLRSPANLAGAVISSFVTWAIEAGVYWIVTFAFDLNVSYALALLVVGTVNLAGLIPASPGQVGVYEFFASTVMIAAGVAAAEAAAYAIVVHVVIWLPVTLVGFFFLARQGLGWSAIARARELEQLSVGE